MRILLLNRENGNEEKEDSRLEGRRGKTNILKVKKLCYQVSFGSLLRKFSEVLDEALNVLHDHSSLK